MTSVTPHRDEAARDSRGLTPRGASVTASGAVAIAIGWIFGIPEIAFLGITGVFAVALALLLAPSPPPLVLRRTSPSTCEVGETIDVTLTLIIPDGGRTGARLSFVDGGPVRGRARFGVSRLRPGETASRTYSLRPNRRGIYSLGPLEYSAEDILGLARRTTTVGSRVEIAVTPVVKALRPLPPRLMNSPGEGAMDAGSEASGPGEFESLRDLTEGEDLRRVHWASSARLDRLVAREDRTSAMGELKIVLDCRRGAIDRQFEEAVEMAAAIASTGTRSGASVELQLLGMGLQVAVPAGRAPTPILEALARADLVSHSAIGIDLRPQSTGLLVVLTGDGPAGSPDLGDRLRRGSCRSATILWHQGTGPFKGDARAVIAGRSGEIGATWARAISSLIAGSPGGKRQPLSGSRR